MVKRKTQNPREGLTALQSLLTLPAVDNMMSQISDPEKQELIKSLISIGNKPEDFAADPAQAIGQTVRAAGQIGAESLNQPSMRNLAQQGQNALINTQPIKQFAGEVAKGAATDPMKNLDPINKARQEVAIKKEKERTEQLIDSGQHDPEEIIKFSNESIQANQQQLNQGMAGQPQQTSDNINNPITDLLKNVTFKEAGLFDFGGQIIKNNDGTITVTTPGKLARMTGQATSGMDILSKIQDLIGEEPLQKGEREKLQLTAANDIAKQLAKVGSPDALQPKQSVDFSLLMDGADATAGISNMLNDNVTAQLFAQGVPNFLKSQNAKLLQAYIERANQARTRIETGAALQPSELKSTSKRFMPQKGDTIETALKRLQPLYSFFEGSLNIADPTGVHRQRAKGIVANRAAGNISQDQINNAKQNGAVGFDTDKGVFVDAQGREVK